MRTRKFYKVGVQIFNQTVLFEDWIMLG